MSYLKTIYMIAQAIQRLAELQKQKIFSHLSALNHSTCTFHPYVPLVRSPDSKSLSGTKTHSFVPY